MSRARAALGLALAGAAALGGAARAADDVPADPARLRGVDPAALASTYAPGVFAPAYEPPAPGTYALPPIDDVRDHALRDVDGHATTLFALQGDRVAVVAFVYLTCVEATGCPVSNATFHGLDRTIADDPDLREHVALVTVSFDPERDTPARLAEIRRLHDPKSAWHFAATDGGAALDGLLDDFGQQVAKLRFADGTWTGLYRHVLKVFLVDRAHRVRNVYSAGFLHPALVLADLRTLLLEDRGTAPR